MRISCHVATSTGARAPPKSEKRVAALQVKNLEIERQLADAKQQVQDIAVKAKNRPQG